MPHPLPQSITFLTARNAFHFSASSLKKKAHVSVYNRMSFFQKFIIIADIFGFFIITRYPYVDLFCILMRHGSMADSSKQGTFNPSAGRLEMTMDAIKQNFEVFINGAIFFVCATGMTLDMQRRGCGVMAAFHVVCAAIMTCIEHKQWSEFMIVSEMPGGLRFA